MLSLRNIICGIVSSGLSACAGLPLKTGLDTQPLDGRKENRHDGDLCTANATYGIIIHGGTARAGKIPQGRLEFMGELLSNLKPELENGATSLQLVEIAISAMENSGLFNAGKAAISNRDGYVETDASIMDGATMKSGAVGSMLKIKNPITAARLVMDETPHAMMVGDRGELAVIELGAETVPAEYFTNNKKTKISANAYANHGTVGAAALDRCGNLAAGTSTGGYDAKIPGRVGDSPIIGASTYAKNGVLAASATGHGEYFIRYTATRSVAARVEYGDQDLATAAAASIREMAMAGGGTAGQKPEGRGGIIAIDKDGNFAMPFSTDGMLRGLVSNTQSVQVSVFDEME